MSTFNDRLYGLVPTIYRIRDSEIGEPLRALLSVVSEQVDVVERDIERLYENWFIETCDEWAIPYIGELVGHQPIVPTRGDVNDPRVQLRNRWLFPRREIANIVRYRRRKGTLPVLEELALDVAGWPALAVEFGKQVVATPDLRSRSLRPRTMPSLRDPDLSLKWGGPFNSTPRTMDLRAADPSADSSQEADSNRPGIRPRHVGVWVWRLPVYPVTGSAAGHRKENEICSFTFHPLGFDTPLYNRPVAVADRTETATLFELPVPLTRSLLATGPDQRVRSEFYGAGKSLVIRIKQKAMPGCAAKPASAPPAAAGPAAASGPAKGGGPVAKPETKPESGEEFVEIPARCIRVCALDATGLATVESFFDDDTLACVDPELGRFVVRGATKPPACTPGLSGADFETTFHYAFGGDLGGGEYRRPRDPHRRPPTWTVSPTMGPIRLDRSCAPPPDEKDKRPATPLDRTFDELKKQLDLLKKRGSQIPADERHLVVELVETGLYCSEGQEVEIPPDCTVELRAGRRIRPFLLFVNSAPCGPLPWRWTLNEGSRLIVDGLTIAAEGICIQQKRSTQPDMPAGPGCGRDAAPAPPDPSAVAIRHSTLVPRPVAGCHCEKPEEACHGRLFVGPGVGEVCLDHAIVGTAVFPSYPDHKGACGGCDGAPVECAPPAVRLTVRDSILGGSIHGGAETTPAAARLQIERSTGLGAIRADEIALLDNSLIVGPVAVNRQQSGLFRFSYATGEGEHPPRLRCLPDSSGAPSFSKEGFLSTTYGDPTYGQLSRRAAERIRMGADDGGEMGVFHDQFLPHREKALRRRLEEFTPATHQLSLLFAN